MVSVTHSIAQAGAGEAPLDLLAEGLPGEAREALARAADYARDLYGELALGTGEAIWQHALGMALVAASLKLDLDTRLAALLFAAPDFLEDAAEKLAAPFGQPVADLAVGLRRLKGLQLSTRRDKGAQGGAQDAKAQSEVLRKMLLAMAEDIRVVLLRLASRTQTLRYLADHPGAAREEVARESLDIYAPLANRIGVWHLKWELEDLAFRFLEPDTYKRIAKMLDERRVERESFIEEAIARLKAEMAAAGVKAEVVGRPKHLYSIYKKMQRKDLELSQLYDVMAVRVITERVQDCYGVLGLVHSLWVPIPSELDDYIAKPKDNGYQSLHTAVIGPRGRPFEVQIRTREMHRFAELGVAAHWAYKEQKSGKAVATDKFMLLRQLMDWERDVSDPHQFVQSLKTDLFEDQVYVFTPGGDVVDLPVGSTPLDFAYRVHSSVGHRCRGARVNDHIVPLDTPLHTGDRVEILTHKEPQPSRDWMNPSLGFLRTASARQKVRQWFRRQGRDEAIAQGRDMVERELARLDLKHATLADVAAALKYPGVEELYAAVGYGDRSTHSVTSAALSIELEKAPPPPPPTEAPAPTPSKQVARGVRINRVDEVVGRRARCCNPVPGDDVVGFVTRGRGIAVHLRRCPHVSSTSEPERLVEIDWGSDGSEVHGVELEIRAHDRAGLMGELSKVVSAVGVNITSARAEGQRGGGAWIRLGLECRSADQVARVMDRLDRHPDVLEVRRVRQA